VCSASRDPSPVAALLYGVQLLPAPRVLTSAPGCHILPPQHNNERIPERYTGELCNQKRDDIYHHVCTTCSGVGQSVYATA
jgi:hypothetical protein